MSTKVAPLGLRLFLEGIEVPVISASVSVQPDTPANASIQVIPTDMSLYFLPRTLVHLFYLDEALSDDEVAAAKAAADSLKGPSDGVRPKTTFEEADLNRFEVSDFGYKILFSGEVIGFHYTKSPTGRQQVLQCMDLSSYWDACYQFFSDYSAGGSGLTDKHHNFVGAGQGMFDNFGGHNWVISKLLNSSPKTPEYQETQGLLGGIIHLLEAIGGIKYRDSEFKGYRGINDFFTIAELRYNLLGMLGAIEKDKTSAKLYASKAFNEWIRNGMTSIGSLVSFRDIINHLNRYIFHNVYPNPCAMYKAGGDTTQQKQRRRAGTKNVVDTVLGRGSKANLKKALVSLNKAILGMNDMLLQIDLNADLPPKESVSSFQVIAAFIALRDADVGVEAEIENVEKSGGSDASKLAQKLREVRAGIEDARDSFPVAEYEGPDQFPETQGNLTSGIEKARDQAKAAADKLDDVFVFESARFRTVFTDIPTAAHLFSQLYLPETFFVSPPRCNVIFPDQYYQLQFSRNFLREVSRLCMQGGLGMLGGGRQGAKLFSRSYLAPKIKDVSGKMLRASMSQASRVILQHEVHSGIIPKMSWVTDGHRWGVKAASGAQRAGDLKKSQKVHYLQRLAEFQFYLSRWSARQLSLTGVFNPNIVCGLPAVVIDRSSPSPAVVERLEKVLRRRMLPTQYLGKVMTYTHTIGQSGGQTSMQLAYARTHRGLDDEFLGVLSKEDLREKESNKFAVNPRNLATKVDPAEVSEEGGDTDETEAEKARTRQQAKVNKNREIRKTIVRMWTEKKLKEKVSIPGLGKAKKVTETGQAVLTRSMALSLGISTTYFDGNKRTVSATQAGVDSTGDVAVINVPERIVIEYEEPAGAGQWSLSGTSMEDALRPDWMAEDVWSNDKITEAVYEPLLGTFAITDDKSIGQDAQDELLKRWKTDQERRISFSPVTVGVTSGEGTASVESVDGKFVYTVVPGSVEESVDGLSLVYGMIKEKRGNLHEFIREFTRRPIANIIDVLGSQNLEFADDGSVADSATMIEGFHSRAFGDYNTDVQLPDREDSSVAAGQKALGALMPGESDPSSVERPAIIGRDEKASAIRPEFDPRGRARGRVRAYVEELRVSRGLLGS